MDSLQKKKLYYEELDKITEEEYTWLFVKMYSDFIHVNINDLSHDEVTKIIDACIMDPNWPIAMFHFQVVMPLDKVYILIEKEHQTMLGTREANGIENEPPLTPKETYETLISFQKHYTVGLMKMFCEQTDISLEIVDTIIRHDESSFLRLFSTINDHDQISFSKLVSYLKIRLPLIDQIKSPYFINNPNRDFLIELSKSLFPNQTANDETPVANSAFPIHYNDCGDTVYCLCLQEVKKYLALKDIMDQHERKTIERLLKHPRFTDIYEKCMEECLLEKNASKGASGDHQNESANNLDNNIPKKETSSDEVVAPYPLPGEISIYTDPKNESTDKKVFKFQSIKEKTTFLTNLANILFLNGYIKDEANFVYAFGGCNSTANIAHLPVVWLKEEYALSCLCYSLFDESIEGDWPKVKKLFFINGRNPEFSNKTKYKFSQKRHSMQKFVIDALKTDY